ncbi:MAG: hypothetical protein AUI14_09440 [Actinobacteria bacterium 13_2_20CM_2_71_6]|nr:MAG: hypothetical protein AUI14_09440 [Actinobacteria bacterium 13_2_20CM_2_71_6]
MTITASALQTMIVFRASPMLVTIVTDRSNEAPSRLSFGRMPTMRPFLARAPAATAAMTPTPPPQMTTAPRSARI